MPQGKGTYGSQVGRPSKKQKGGNNCIGKVKGVDVCSLTMRQQKTLEKHSVHHSKKHIAMMVNAMKNGASFGASHKMAQKKVGK
tara:strand:+ start:9645 stop:9896 length:252 start_codon:yes stop_codon:yes gene_type:complete